MKNQKYSSNWSDFKESLDLSKEELAEIDLKFFKFVKNLA